MFARRFLVIMKRCLKENLIIALIIGILVVCVFVSCGNIRTETSATTVTTIDPNITQAAQKLETKTKYDVLEVYGYDGFRYGKKANDILVDDIIRIKTVEIALLENDMLDIQIQERILEEYNVDISELDISLINREIDVHIEDIYKGFFKTECKKNTISFLETVSGKYALQYKIDTHIYETEEEHWNSDFRHFIVYLN